MREFTVIIIFPQDSLTLLKLEGATTVPQEELVTLQKDLKRAVIVKRASKNSNLFEAFMQNNPNNPYDDVFNNLSKIVEEIVKNMPDNEHARIIGYTIISRQPMNGEPGIFRADIPDDGEIPYEMTETDDQIFITAEMPTTIKNAPVVDIKPECVRITADDITTTIILEHKVDRIHSYYRVHRSVMDITLKKEPLF